MTALVFILMGAAAVVSTALTFGVRWLGRRALLHDSAGSAGHAKVLRRVPNIGGVAIFVTVAGLMLIGLGVAARNADPDAPCLVRDGFAGAAVHMQGIRDQTPMALGLLGCLLVLHVMGLIDDRRAVNARLKLAVMAAAAGAMVIGFDCRLLTMLDAHAGGPWASWAVTIAWFVVVTNAMNFIDNMDGLSAGVGVTASGFFLAAALMHGQWFIAAALAVLIGALLGFLVFNFPWGGLLGAGSTDPRTGQWHGEPGQWHGGAGPSRGRGATIFMGDGGSLVVGFLLAFLTVRTTYVDPTLGGGWYGVFMPLCVLAVPLYDFVSVCVIRVSQGRSPMVGDQQHFSHRLRARGLSVVRTLAVICGCCAVTGVGGLLLGSASAWQAVAIGVQTLLVLALLALYEHGSGKAGRGV